MQVNLIEIIIKYTSLENSTITKKLRKNVELKSSKPKIIMPIIQEEKQEKEDIVKMEYIFQKKLFLLILKKLMMISQWNYI